MSKFTLKNVAAVSIHGKQPGETFTADAVDGAPVALLWRKRMAEGSIEIVSASKPTPPPASSSDAFEGASTKPKKGKS